MKNISTRLIAFCAVLFFLLVILPGCKQNENTDDLASTYVGTYTNSEPYQYMQYSLAQTTYFTVTRASASAVNIVVTRNASSSFVPTINCCYYNVALNTQSQFSINTTDSCYTAAMGYTTTANGTGSFTPNSITMDWTLTNAAFPQHQNIIATK